MPLVTLLDRRPCSWLVLGAVLSAFTLFQTPIAALGWLAAVPWLRYVRLRPGWRGASAVFFMALLAGNAAVVRIITDPLPLAMAPLFGLPIGFFVALPFVALAFLKVDGARRILAFALLATLSEVAQRTGTPFLSWGSAAYTQMENLPLMQVASLGGLSAVSLLVHAVGATLEAALAGDRVRRPAIAVATTVLVAQVWGAARLHSSEFHATDTAVVAAIDTPSDIGGPDLPDAATVADWNAILASRTRRAAAAGAELAVWTEASTLVLPGDVDTFHAFLGDLAAETGLELVVGYVVPLPGERFQYENTYVFVRPDGSVDHTYLKHEPVPGEPAVRGTAPQQVVETDVGRVGGAVCYDYDAPYIGVGHARLGADLVALPSSDWRGIDPVHTRMAAVRAIEGGHSVLRSTRWGLSAGIDPQGRMQAQRSAFDDPDDGVLLARLPRSGRTTLFSALGDGGVGALLLLALAATLLSARYARPGEFDRPHDRGARRPGGLRGAGDRPPAAA